MCVNLINCCCSFLISFAPSYRLSDPTSSKSSKTSSTARSCSESACSSCRRSSAWTCPNCGLRVSETRLVVLVQTARRERLERVQWVLLWLHVRPRLVRAPLAIALDPKPNDISNQLILVKCRSIRVCLFTLAVEEVNYLDSSQALQLLYTCC